MVVVVNHVPGFSYDANGDVTNDAANTYAYNVEGRPMTVNGYGQIFDAFDRLVESQNAGGYTSIVYSPDGYKLALMNGSSVVKYMAPLAAGMQAVYTANTPAGVAYWRHADWLGSSRLAPTAAATCITTARTLRLARPMPRPGTTNRNFTGQTEDTTPGLYDFLFRQQSQSQGRWLVPDPAGLAAVDITNPQTWNRYAYVGNNPLNAIDPLGLYCAISADGGTFRGCTQGAAGYGWGGGEWDNWGTSPTYPDPYSSPWPLIITGIWDVLGNIGGGGGGGGSNPPPGGGTGGGGNIANFPNGESLGIPNGLPTPNWGLAAALIPPAICGDMGPCQFGFEGAVLLSSDPNWWQKFKQYLSPILWILAEERCNC